MSTFAPPPELLVADSFRVRARSGVAEVRGFQRHLERFVRSVGRARAQHRPAAAGSPDIDTFLAASLREIADFGEGFPRLELWREASGDLRYDYTLRPLPPLGESLTMRSVSLPAPPQVRVKGPHIAAYAALTRQLGAEPLLIHPDGRVREGATTSLVFWPKERESSGCVVADTARVESVSESILAAAALRRFAGRAQLGDGQGAFARATVTVAELSRCEVWAVNALHGIRPVSRINDVELAHPDAERLSWFREALDAAWEPILR
ncbi:aminotransferase class IV [Leucobacter aridicollis]|uniref:aminotransferase class IV n=1 Tax=Leucobacter aridicollis TaxID=283878 RepID=UPI00210803CF|nr:aminotransferase class IV [Leucobacter aridicollis]UTX51869.1 aminotransferase class IV [Leucobacter aridicollis]